MENPVNGSDLRSGKSTGCRSCAILKHGHSSHRAGKLSREYKTWMSMKQRCANPKAGFYARYGGRGITVCDRWNLFVNFLADMGVRPPDHSLDRIDNDGNYEPGNCRWATRKQQSYNKSNNRTFTYKGKTKCVKEWCAFLGMDEGLVRGRLGLNWPFVKAIETPLLRTGKDSGRDPATGRWVKF